MSSFRWLWTCAAGYVLLAVHAAAFSPAVTVTAVAPAAAAAAGTVQPLALLLASTPLQSPNTSTLMPGAYYVVGPSAANVVVTLGYTVSIANGTSGRFSIQLMSDVNYAQFRNGQAYSYYVTYSATDVTTAAYASQSFTSVAPLYLVLMPSPLTSTVTVTYNIGFFQGRCPVAGGCSNGGVCTITGCSCATGWAGAACQTRVCAPACVHGTCSNTATCTCDSGWSGVTCDVFTCNPPCRNGATCVGPLQCACTPEWRGDTCEDPTPGTLSIERGSTFSSQPCPTDNSTATRVPADTIVLYNLEPTTGPVGADYLSYLYLRDAGVLQLTCVRSCTGTGVSYVTAVPVSAGVIGAQWQVVYQFSATGPVAMCSQVIIRAAPPNGPGGGSSSDTDWTRDPTVTYVLLGVAGAALVLCGVLYHRYRVAASRQMVVPPPRQPLVTAVIHTPARMSSSSSSSSSSSRAAYAPPPYPLDGRQLYNAHDPSQVVEGSPRGAGNGYGALP